MRRRLGSELALPRASPALRPSDVALQDLTLWDPRWICDTRLMGVLIRYSHPICPVHGVDMMILDEMLLVGDVIVDHSATGLQTVGGRKRSIA